ncbi:type VII secretion protein EccE [Streptomyces montanisoli]|uniref:Type VII secretion protein EccE n=1 Tax=Streptomyces montanisoli TaxID=2798581 RepID=A0A940RXB2_9ACTN|nr:type VII secretion protein EccE [Streptomyces montanisoli]MBP0460390.1 type VII secretion protein EccE [Streptomyces montanisoli]
MASATQSPPAAAGPPATPSPAPAATPSAAGRTARPGHFGPLRMQQIVLFELAAAALLVGWVISPLMLVPAGVVAAVLVLLAVVRRHRRSLTEWLGTAMALRRRTRRAAALAIPQDVEPGLAPAVECDPALRTYVYSERDRRPVGMIGDGTFLTTVVRIESDGSALRADRAARPLPVALLREILDFDGIRLESAQIVQHTQPAPAPHLPPQSMAARNYAPLQAQTGAPALRITWVALKLDPELCAEAVAARGGGLLGAQKCAVRAADQLASRLAGAGFRATVLTDQELTSAIAVSTCASPMAIAQAGRAAAQSRRTKETSRTWRCDDRRHTTYWVARWPELGAGGASMPHLVALLTSIPALATTFSLTVGRGERQGVTVAGHVRITGRSDEELLTARHELERTARGVRTSLVRLDREQVPGMLATLPLGGTR